MHSVHLKLSNSLTQLASWVVILHALPGNWSTRADAFANSEDIILVPQLMLFALDGGW